jgi:anthranilate synthase component 1
LPIGLFGGFAYDMVRQFEVVPDSASDPLQDADYCFYLPSQLFIVDHPKNRTYFVSLLGEGALTELVRLSALAMEVVIPPITLGPVTSDVSRDTFLSKVEVMKTHVFEGDVFQAQYGRLEQASFQGNPFLVYQKLKALNPSPYMFFSRDAEGVTLGCSPELAISVSFTKLGEREITITPIAGTKPRGFVDGKINPQLDERYGIALQTDTKELAEHVMLIDLARNDIAAIAKSGTTVVDESIVVKKYSHVQHLVSRVTGILRDDIDALTAYLATMNMGTLTGAPKVKAMQLIAMYEVSARAFYGGGIGFITYRGEMETAIVIRSMRIKKDTVFLRASAGIVADSVPASEYQETVNKLRACRRALEEAAK